jgi:peptidoglycan/LPS O-acetylase OafA/YrhL
MSQLIPPKSPVDDVRSYKPFLDGLRAIAILTVVGAHVGVPGFAGGYVGVDIFFVISGYLIIGQIESDIGQNRFTFRDFAARRALRILPPFLLIATT